MKNQLTKALISFLMIVFGATCLQYESSVGIIGAALMGAGVGLVLTLKKKLRNNERSSQEKIVS